MRQFPMVIIQKVHELVECAGRGEATTTVSSSSEPAARSRWLVQLMTCKTVNDYRSCIGVW